MTLYLFCSSPFTRNYGTTALPRSFPSSPAQETFQARGFASSIQLLDREQTYKTGALPVPVGSTGGSDGRRPWCSRLLGPRHQPCPLVPASKVSVFSTTRASALLQWKILTPLVPVPLRCFWALFPLYFISISKPEFTSSVADGERGAFISEAAVAEGC